MAQGKKRTGSNCTPKTEYNFIGDFTMNSKVVMFGKDTMNLKSKMSFSEEGKYMSITMESGFTAGINMLTLMDLADSNFIMLMDLGGKKKGTCMSMKSEEYKSKMNVKVPPTKSWSDFKETGREKKILGHMCKEYIAEDSLTKQSIWTTLELRELAKVMTTGPYGINFGSQNLPPNLSGVILEFEMFDKAKEAWVLGNITEVNENKPSVVSTEGYDFH